MFTVRVNRKSQIYAWHLVS